MNEDFIVRAFLRRFRDNFSGAANAVDADDPGFDPRDSDEWFEFHIDQLSRKRRHRTDKLRVDFLAAFSICVKSPESNVYTAADYADELRELFEFVCFDVTDESGSQLGKIQTFDLSLSDASADFEQDLGEIGSLYVCKLRACATEV